MQFIDTTGHIFYMESYSELPIGYEYEKTPYIFWIDNEYSQKLSVNNYYILPIRVLIKKLEHTALVKIKAEIESDVFKLYKFDDNADNIQPEISINDNFEKTINCNLKYDENDFNASLISNTGFNLLDLPIDNNEKYSILTFYVIGNTTNEGTWLSNILISCEYIQETQIQDSAIDIEITEKSVFCPITIGGVFVDEIEQLKINTRNIGVKLPAEIIKAVFNYQYDTETIDVTAYNTKLKEYLINHMILKSECGNYNSVLAALDWFGWKNKLNVVKQLKTDNDIIEQFINDHFNIEEDIISAFKHFKNSTYISLYLNENQIIAQDTIDINKEFWGEGTPILESLIDKEVFEEIDGIKFKKLYYDYNFRELGLKLSCLSYMLKTYFLPIHLSIKTAAINHQTFANNIKLLNKSSISIIEEPIFNGNKYFNIEFDDQLEYFLYNQNITIDDKFNDIENISNIGLQNEICAKIPINFVTNSDDDYIYNCLLFLSKDDKIIYNSDFIFTSKNKYNSFVILPNKLNSSYPIVEWENKSFKIDIYCNGFWYSKEFKLRLPDLQCNLGVLKYKYDNNEHRQIKSIENYNTNNPTINFLSNIFESNLVTVNVANFHKELNFAINNDRLLEYNEKLIQTITINENKKYYNKIYIYDITNNQGNPIYGKIGGEDNLQPYKDFFNSDGTSKVELIIDNVEFDFYLMQDSSDSNYKYYGVFISKDTIPENYTETEINLITPNSYNFTKYRSDEIFLINRMEIINTNGENIFKPDDIIIAKIENVNLPFLLSLGSKWEFENISLGSYKIEPVISKTNYAIMSISKNQQAYHRGFYKIIAKYSIDNKYYIERKLEQMICIK